MPSELATELRELARLADQDKPFLKEQLARVNAAAAEPTIAGQLRRRIHDCRIPLSVLERSSGLPLSDIGAFIEGGELSIGAFCRLAAASGMRIEMVEELATINH